MKNCNGWRSWNGWNVALWLYNDESNYNIVMESIEYAKSKSLGIRTAVRRIISQVGERTPDGGKYNYLSVKNAIFDDFYRFND